MKPISFLDNVHSKHGECLRSSAVFYYKHSINVETTVSVFDYWKLKRGLEVAVFASLRDMDGTLHKRWRVLFEHGPVVNLRPQAGDGEFEGSLEIEAFSTKNMVIPYAAVTAIYKSSRGISLVHSYGRHYSNHEIEEGRTITSGREGCWSLREDGEHTSFCVFHNGASPKAAQRAKFTAVNSRNEQVSSEFDLEPLAAYSTRKFYPAHQFPRLKEFLGDQYGYGTLDFDLSGSFTRMLVGVETPCGADLQVTHSNFNYSKHATDFVPDEFPNAYMAIPSLGQLSDTRKSLVIYPDSVPGTYTCRSTLESAEAATVEAGIGANLDLPPGEQTWTFGRSKGAFPTRLVTALRLSKASGAIPNECSLGVITPLQPKKRLWWGVCCGESAHMKSYLIAHDLAEIYGGIAPTDKISISIHSSRSPTPLSLNISGSQIEALSDGMSIDELFPNAGDFLGGDFGYYTFFHEYGGLTAYTLFVRETGSVALEHGF